MKKTVLFFVLATVVAFSVITGCKSYSPTAAATATAVPTPMGGSSAIVSVPGGTFTQTDGTSSFSHTISAFKLGKYQVTYDLWYTVYQWAIVNGYTFQNAGVEGSNGTIGAVPTTAKYQPVTTVNWRDAIVWCNAFSQKTGLSLVYCSNAGFTTPIKSSANGSYGSSINTTPGSFDNPYVNWSTNGFRLPTEGEYQYAASYQNGSSWTLYNYASGATADYSDAIATGLVGWYYDNAWMGLLYITHNVGGKTANALGIYDMSGNVWEWCWDWYGTYPGTSTNYRGPASGSDRVLRGGSYSSTADVLRVGGRINSYPCSADYDIGFRFARTN